MTTLAVFGMSESWAREEAKESTSTHKMEDGKRIERTIAEWEEAVAAEVARIMVSKKSVRLTAHFLDTKEADGTAGERGHALR
ncbi:hypothetical protein [Pseudomonas koreensis]|uniref:hypothetical protein n=1 Tax=Pseudomonas koreensis TaxID=198620 RepID=UPI0032081AF1